MSEEFPTIKIETEQAETKGEVQLEEVAELEAPIKIIIEKIKDRIESDEYGLIIGDDASGRIPTRILGGFIREVSKDINVFVPNIIFIPGKLEMARGYFGELLSFKKRAKKEQQEELDKYLLSKGASKERRVLIVTDTLKSGYSLKTLVDLLRKAGYVCDIATIGIELPIIGQGIKESLRGIDIFSGEYNDKSRKENKNTPLIYRPEASNLTGVYKRPGDKVSKTLKSSGQEIQESINKSRKDVNVVVDRLIDWYEFQKQEK